jgi:hypothetical protein
MVSKLTLIKKTMDYNFFLFTKLHDVIFPSKVEYDLQFDNLKVLFYEWEEWDEKNGDGIGTYESILKFLEK